MDSIDLWKRRIGKFCIIDYQSTMGIKSAIGELIAIIDNKLILKNLANDEEYEVRIDIIRNCVIKEKREFPNDSA